MTTLGDKAILLGADNRPPMLEKDMYDSWKSKMELYMMNRQHGRMILKSVENGPLIWPTIEENGVTMPRKYSELTPTEAIQADCDVKETNIILQGLPPGVYALAFTINQQTQLPEFPQLNSGLTVLVFNQGDDPIDAVNHIMSFLLAFFTSRYPTTNNQLRNSSKLRQQATIDDGRVTLQPVHGRQISFAIGTTRTYTPGASESNYGKQRTVICYKCKGEGRMYKQYTKPKRKRDDACFKDKLLLEAVHNSNSSAQQDALILSVIEQLKTQNSMNSSDPSPSCRPTKVEVPKELPKVSMEKGLIIAALRDELRKLKGKALVDNAITTHTIAPEMLKIDVEPLAPRLLNNRTAHSDYLRLTQEQAAILKEGSIVSDVPSSSLDECSLELALHEMTPTTISSRLMPNPPPSTTYLPSSRSDWDILFQPLFDDLFNPSPSVDPPSLEVIAQIAEVVAPEPAISTGSPFSKTVDQDAPSPRLQISKSPRGIVLNQSKYAIEYLKKYGMESSDPVDTPMVEKSKLDRDPKGKPLTLHTIMKWQSIPKSTYML
nr:uncharacterized mitochondrial protein AtMg00810-like [Tanacetum cinerariifolium]